MGLIKSAHVPVGVSPFSMVDVENAAKGVLLRARQQAEKLIAAAQLEGQKLKEEARAQGAVEGRTEGMALGMAEGRKAGEQQALNEQRAALQQAFNAMTNATTLLDASRLDLESVALQEVVKLAISIAHRITKRQGLLQPDMLIANLEEAMKLVVQQADIRVAIHPAQRQTLDVALPQLALKWPALKHVEVTEDAQLLPGGCRVYTRQGQIDADLDAQLDHIIADLLPLPPELAP